MAEKNTYSHPHYTHVEDVKDADALGWAFVNKDEMIKFPFKFEELPPEEVKINITHTGLCHSDVLTARSLWGPANYPIVVGHEIVGTVAQIGKEVKSLKVGDRVAVGALRNSCEKCRPCQKGANNCCTGISFAAKCTYGEFWGGYSTSCQVPALWAFKVPESLPSDKTPPILCAGVTVYAPLARYAKSSSRVGVIGIGGLGHMAVQYANKMGCHVTAFSATPGKEKLLRELGAHEVSSSVDAEQLKKLSSSFDVIVNTLSVGASDVFSLYLDLLDADGVFVQVGAPAVTENFSINAFQIIPKNISFAGSGVGSRKETTDCLEFSARHNVLPMVEHFEFEDFQKAFDTLENGRPKFRCVVDVEKFAKKHNLHK